MTSKVTENGSCVGQHATQRPTQRSTQEPFSVTFDVTLHLSATAGPVQGRPKHRVRGGRSVG